MYPWIVHFSVGNVRTGCLLLVSWATDLFLSISFMVDILLCPKRCERDQNRTVECRLKFKLQWLLREILNGCHHCIFSIHSLPMRRTDRPAVVQWSSILVPYDLISTNWDRRENAIACIWNKRRSSFQVIYDQFIDQESCRVQPI